MKENGEELFSGVDEWPVVVDCMNIHRVTPEMLSKGTGMAVASILRGIKDFDMPITLRFLRDCLRVFDLLPRVSGRGDVISNLGYDECMTYLKRPSAMPPLPGNFWERDE